MAVLEGVIRVAPEREAEVKAKLIAARDGKVVRIDATPDSPLRDFCEAMRMLPVLYPPPVHFHDHLGTHGRPSRVEIFWKVRSGTCLYREVVIEMVGDVYQKTLNACRKSLIEMEEESLKLNKEGEDEAVSSHHVSAEEDEGTLRS
ncbi:MAG TPA: hypothetical protein VNH18_35470 [Bryobacteraceae bacterium]|nr:hypothetical protein [Bryobacteraceae bacterium]